MDKQLIKQMEAVIKLAQAFLRGETQEVLSCSPHYEDLRQTILGDGNVEGQ